MNKKGFAISIVLYSLVFLLISILYMILGVLKARYHVENDLRDAIVQELNDSIIVSAAESISRVKTLEEVGGAKRYVGADPDNYVLFNGEQWRIIGVYGNRIKIIRAMPLIASQKYNNSNTREWNGSAIQTFLNGTYYTGLSSDAMEMVDTASWEIGSTITTYSFNASQAYDDAKTSRWTGKVGLISDYEYLYASGSSCSTVSGNNFSATCISNDWLYKAINDNQGNSAWTIHNSLLVLGDGKVNVPSSATNTYLVNPVVYLKSSVRIAGGKGKVDKEYKLGYKAS